MSTIDTAIAELHKGFLLLNNRMFQGALPTPAILVQNQGTRKRNILGWCTQEKIWADKEKTIQMFEINITAEYLNRPVTEIMGTMLHEMVHLYCNIHDIKDTSRAGTYHNKRFKEQAESFGMDVSFSKDVGWATTQLRPETEKIMEDLQLDTKAFRIKRFTWGDSESLDEDDWNPLLAKPLNASGDVLRKTVRTTN